MASSTSPSNNNAGAPAMRRVTPSQNDDDDALDRLMSVEKGIVDELLLVCGVIGSTDPSTNEFIPVTDCLNWLQDLQRALRRDDDTYRPISLLIGNWKVVQQKLLPLVKASRYDNPMVLTIVKILVILTKPLSETTKRAGRMVIDTKNRKVPESVVKEQIKLRENALEQSDMLMEYKRAFLYEQGIMGIFVSLLAEPLSKTGTSRSELDHLTIELVLHLFRNLLSAQPILKSSTETSQKSLQLHNELVCLFEKELVLEIVYVISQEMEARENAQYNLLLMELLNHLLRNQDPTLVARSSTIANKPKPPRVKPTASASTKSAARPPKSGSLSAQLQREKLQLRPPTTSRHSHFGGTLVVNRLDGKRQYMSAALVKQGTTTTQLGKKRKNKRTDPFIGLGRSFASHSKIGGMEEGSSKAQRTLHTFCSRFIQDCYGPLMKSLKNEFRRDSQRLEEGDKVVFFKLIWFFSQWWRVAGRSSSQEQSNNALGQLIFTMDVFTFNLVLNATDTFQQHKKYTQLAQSIALYSEMMQLLHVMYHSKDSTENLMALGLLDRLFYGSEPLDRLPKLLSKWKAGTLTREAVCDLVELVHVSLKLLEANSSSASVVPSVDKKKKATKSNDAVARMKQTAAEFDLPAYIIRKIVSNQLLFMYTHVLSQYQVNAPHVNHHIVALFLRIMKMHVVFPDDDEERGESMPKNPLAVKPATLEPMLYNIQLFVVLDQVLNDATIRKEKEYSALLSFATSLMGRFAKHSQSNPLAYVECLFRHPVPHRFCELTTNLYVNEELRMIAERELLLEEHRRLAEAEGEEEDDADESLFRRHSGRHAGRSGLQTTTRAQPDDDDDDEEVEWDDGDNMKAKESSSAAKDDESDKSDAEKDDDSDVEVDEDKDPKSDSNVEKDATELDAEKDDDVDEPMETEPVVPDAEKDANASDVEKDGLDAMNVEKNAEDTKSDDETSNAFPKRKLLSDIDGNAPKSSPEKKARLQKKSVDDHDSSDEELGFETQPPPGAGSNKSSGLVFEDDEDDE